MFKKISWKFWENLGKILRESTTFLDNFPSKYQNTPRKNEEAFDFMQAFVFCENLAKCLKKFNYTVRIFQGELEKFLSYLLCEYFEKLSEIFRRSFWEFGENDIRIMADL